MKHWKNLRVWDRRYFSWGTDNVTLDGVLDLLVRVRRFEVPIALEISTIDAVTPGMTIISFLLY